MKRQNHGMTVNRDNLWPIEEIEEKRNILNESNDHREIGKQSPSIARAKEGLASEHYHRAVAELAYELWEKSGRPQDSADRNWSKAEATLKPLWAADLSFSSMDSPSDRTAP
jgi:hypothetical protein